MKLDELEKIADDAIDPDEIGVEWTSINEVSHEDLRRSTLAVARAVLKEAAKVIANTDLAILWAAEYPVAYSKFINDYRSLLAQLTQEAHDA